MGIKEKWVSIYVDLDWLIKAGILKPGDRCEADAIAQAWGVPDEVVIKALRLLAGEGRLKPDPRAAGYIVAPSGN